MFQLISNQLFLEDSLHVVSTTKELRVNKMHLKYHLLPLSFISAWKICPEKKENIF